MCKQSRGVVSLTMAAPCMEVYRGLLCCCWSHVWTISLKREDKFSNFLAYTPFTLQRCLAKLLDIFRCGFRRSNPKTLLELTGYFDFPKLSSKKRGSELIFAHDSEASKISKWLLLDHPTVFFSCINIPRPQTLRHQ